MKSRLIIAPMVFLFALLFCSSLLMAQSTQDLKAVEKQMKMVERQIEHANYNMKFDFQQSENRSSLVLSKRYSGETVSKPGNFEVDKDIREVQLSINGEVNSGMIILEIKKPNGETLKTLTLDDTADIRWEQSVAINEENKAQYVGKWTYKITTNNASGEYRLSIRTK